MAAIARTMISVSQALRQTKSFFLRSMSFSNAAMTLLAAPFLVSANGLAVMPGPKSSNSACQPALPLPGPFENRNSGAALRPFFFVLFAFNRAIVIETLVQLSTDAATLVQRDVAICGIKIRRHFAANATMCWCRLLSQPAAKTPRWSLRRRRHRRSAEPWTEAGALAG